MCQHRQRCPVSGLVLLAATSNEAGIDTTHTKPPRAVSVVLGRGVGWRSLLRLEGRALCAPADERRVVTMLFSDLVGFTPLSEKSTRSR